MKPRKIDSICSPEAYQFLTDWIRQRYPNQPYPPAPETYFYKTVTHREYLSRWLECVITRVLNNNEETMAKKVETVGAKVKNKYGEEIRVKKRASRVGEPDVTTTIKDRETGIGRTVYFEVKIGRDKLSDEQLIFHERARKAGCLVFTVRTVDEFIAIYNSLLN